MRDLGLHVTELHLWATVQSPYSCNNGDGTSHLSLQPLPAMATPVRVAYACVPKCPKVRIHSIAAMVLLCIQNMFSSIWKINMPSISTIKATPSHMPTFQYSYPLLSLTFHIPFMHAVLPLTHYTRYLSHLHEHSFAYSTPYLLPRRMYGSPRFFQSLHSGSKFTHPRAWETMQTRFIRWIQESTGREPVSGGCRGDRGCR